MTVYLFAYRDWAWRIGRDLEKIDVIVTPNEYFEESEYYYSYEEDEVKKSYKPIIKVDPKNLRNIRDRFTSEDILLFYGWSWMVPACYTDELLCVCLHPSPLPKYRGGSPIQNQIMAGETTSAVTLFKMGQGLDDGPIFKQSVLFLKGDLYDIFNSLHNTGYELTKCLLLARETSTLVFIPQDESQATFCKRRKPKDSQILPTDTAKDIYNKVRSLLPPYPNAYIMGSDGKKIFITRAECEEENVKEKS